MCIKVHLFAISSLYFLPELRYHQKWDLAGIDQNSPVSTGVAASQVKNIEQGLS